MERTFLKDRVQEADLNLVKIISRPLAQIILSEETEKKPKNPPSVALRQIWIEFQTGK